MRSFKPMSSIVNESKVADVAAYVKRELASYEFVKELKEFMEDKKIGGESFLNFTDNKLEKLGLEFGVREKLLDLVKRTKGVQEEKDDEENIIAHTLSFEIPPKKLCQGFGSDWEYQLDNEIKDDLKKHILSHFGFWKVKKLDK